MKNAFALALRYLAYNRLRTVIIVVCLAIVIFLPVAVHTMANYYNRVMTARAEATPLVIGPPGSMYDLVLSAVYFKGKAPGQLAMADADYVRNTGLAQAVPMNVRYTAGGLPIVGTTLDYFDFRELRVASGTLPRILGDVVLGGTAARQLGLGVGDKLLSDDASLYNPASTYPLLMHVVGVLAESHTTDDRAVFCDLKTTWVIAGLEHGHAGNAEVSPTTIMPGTTADNVVLSAAVTQYNEITSKNIGSFHFHADPEALPITAVIVLPNDAKSETILAARYGEAAIKPDPSAARGAGVFAASVPAGPPPTIAGPAQAVRPRKVVADMMDIVFGVKRSIQAILIVVLATTLALLGLVMMLSFRIRAGEFRTLHRMGCSRWTVAALFGAETSLLLAASAAIAAGLLAAAMGYVVNSGILL